MQKTLGTIALFALAAGALSAQDFEHWPVSLGLKAGVPVTQMFDTGNSNDPVTSGSTIYHSSVPRYEVGVSAEFHLPWHLRFEVDGLYKPGGFNASTGGPLIASLPPGAGLGSFTAAGASSAYIRTRFNQWEIPGLFKYNITLGHYRPFIDFGASYRHISTLDTRTYIGSAAPVFGDNSSIIANRNSFGGVAGIGITFKKGPFELTPEARYTRWANSSFSDGSFKSNKDQGDVLLGVTF